MNPVIATSKIAGMATSALLSFGVPVALFILWKKRTRAKWTAALCGAVIFYVFVGMLEGGCHRLILLGNSGVAAFLNANTWAYVLYAGLMAGLFEETGRFFAFRKLLRKQNGKETSVMYGIGHGGIEAMLLAGLAAVSNLVFAFSLNATGLDAMIAGASTAAQEEAIRQMAALMMNTGAGMFFVGGIERLTAITLHIALSVLVFFAARRKNKLYLYPLAILLHAAVDMFAALYQRGVLQSIILVEICVAIATAFIALFAWRLYRADNVPAEPLPEDIPEEMPEEMPEEISEEMLEEMPDGIAEEIAEETPPSDGGDDNNT